MHTNLMENRGRGLIDWTATAVTQLARMLTITGNAVNDFCSRIRENSGVFGVVPKSHDFGYAMGPRLFPLSNRSRRCSKG